MSDDEAYIKQIEALIENYEAKHSKELEDAQTKVAETMIEAIVLAKDQRREVLLNELHKDLSFLLSIPPIKLTQLIVAASADKHRTRNSIRAWNKEAIDALPDDLREKLYRVLDVEDRNRNEGIARLQAFLKVRPALLAAFEELKPKG